MYYNRIYSKKNENGTIVLYLNVESKEIMASAYTNCQDRSLFGYKTKKTKHGYLAFIKDFPSNETIKSIYNFDKA